MKHLLLILFLGLLLVSCQDKLDPVSSDTETAAAFHKSPDGSDQLGPIEIPIETGSGFAAGGIGLQAGAGNINLDIPADATIKQVLIYWSGGFPMPNKDEGTGDNEISVAGNSVTGTLIGGPTWFFYVSGEGQFNWTSYRADITSLNLINPGSNSILVDGLDYGSTENNGAGIFVIYEEPGQSAQLSIFDGQDVAYAGFTSPEYRQSTVPQTFTFDAADADRTAELLIYAGSVYDTEQRSSIIRVTPDNGSSVDYQNILSSNNGEAWDTAILDVDIPAGATSVTVELISGGDDAFRPASLVWITGALSVPVPQEEGGCTNTYGYWKTHAKTFNWGMHYDETWDKIGNKGEFTNFYLSKQSYISVMWTPTFGNAYYSLAHQFIAAHLNILNGASVPGDVLNAWNEAENLFKTYSPYQVNWYNRDLQSKFKSYIEILTKYNEGTIGPGHCDCKIEKKKKDCKDKDDDHKKCDKKWNKKHGWGWNFRW